MNITPILKNGKRRWQVDYCILGRRKRPTFSTKEDAESFVREHVSKIGNEGPLLSSMSQAERVAIVSLYIKIRELGLTEHEVLTAAITNRKVTPLVPKVVEECLGSKTKLGRRPRYVKQLSHVLNHFASSFPNTQIDRVTPSEIETWLNSGDYASVSRRSRFTDVRTLFAFAVKRSYCKENPFERIDSITVVRTQPGVLRVKAAQKLMRVAYNRDRTLCPWLALALFAGIRPEELTKLTRKNLAADLSVIEVPAEIAKTGRRRVSEIPENAREWLKLVGELPPVNIKRRFERLRRQAGLFKNWPHDAMRHSAATYRYALTDDAAKVAKWLGNSVTIMLTNYNATRTSGDGQMVTKKMAEDYFQIKPMPMFGVLEKVA